MWRGLDLGDEKKSLIEENVVSLQSENGHGGRYSVLANHLKNKKQ